MQALCLGTLGPKQLLQGCQLSPVFAQRLHSPRLPDNGLPNVLSLREVCNMFFAPLLFPVKEHTRPAPGFSYSVLTSAPEQRVLHLCGLWPTQDFISIQRAEHLPSHSWDAGISAASCNWWYKCGDACLKCVHQLHAFPSIKDRSSICDGVQVLRKLLEVLPVSEEFSVGHRRHFSAHPRHQLHPQPH